MPTDTSDDTTPLRVVNLQVSNLLRLRALDITPEDGAPVILGGRNAQGKSSGLAAITIGLGGKRACPPKPVRSGARQADIILDLGEIVIERTIRGKSGAHDLTVKRRDGSVVERPQAVLDGLYNAIAVDPLAFARMAPREQAETLRAVLELDFSAFDAERAGVYEDRRDQNRILKEVEGTLATLPPAHRDAPAAEVSVRDLAAELARRQAHNREVDSLAQDAEDAEQRADAAEAAVERAEKALEAARDAATAAFLGRKIATRALDAAVRLDEEEASAALLGAEDINRKVRANAQRAALVAHVCDERDAVDALTARIEAIDEEKRAALAAAQFPVSGLGFDADGGVLLNDRPLEQASQAEKIRIGVAVGAAQNPRLRVLIVHDGSLLDPDSMAALVALAREQGCQLWIEDARTTDPAAVIIEDGEALAAGEK